MNESTPSNRHLIKVGILIGIHAFFLVAGYEMSRSPATVLFQHFYGVNNLSLVTAVMPLQLILMVGLYNWILSKVGPRRTFMFTCFASGLASLAFAQMIHLEIKIASAFLYIFNQIYIMFLIEQTWSYINSIWDVKNAKKWYGFFAGMFSLGGVIGGLALGELVKPLGTLAMTVGMAILLVPSIICMEFAFRMQPVRDDSKDPRNETKTDELGMRTLFSSRLLIMLFLLVMCTQVVSTASTLNFQMLTQKAYPNMDEQTQFSGRFMAMSNGLATVFQFLVAPFLLRWVSHIRVQQWIPFTHLITSALSLFFPSLWSVSLSQIMFKSLDYSLFRVTKEILYIPLSFDVRYRAKSFIDVFGYRASKGISSGVLYAIGFFGMSMGLIYSAGMFIASLVWVGIVVLIRKEIAQTPQD